MIRMLLIASLLPASCGVSGFDGAAVTAPPLDSEAQTPCDRPEDHLSAGDWELIAGRIGDALIECEDRRSLAVKSYKNITEGQN